MQRKTIIIVVAAIILLTVLPFASLKISGMAVFNASANSILNTLLMAMSAIIVLAFVYMMVKENNVQ